MRVIRSWPAKPPPHRPHVIDELERLTIDNYDYTPLGDVWVETPATHNASVVLLEWDIAVDPVDLTTFAARAAAEPRQVRVAAYRLHDSAGPRWVHRRVSGRHASGERWIDYMEPFCDYFGFGLVYLPAGLIAGFLDAPAPARGRPPWAPDSYDDTRFTDQTFSTWLRWRTSHGPVPIDWDIPVVHLNGPPLKTLLNS